jgi:hypothetical protein
MEHDVQLLKFKHVCRREGVGGRGEEDVQTSGVAKSPDLELPGVIILANKLVQGGLEAKWGGVEKRSGWGVGCPCRTSSCVYCTCEGPWSFITFNDRCVETFATFYVSLKMQ